MMKPKETTEQPRRRVIPVPGKAIYMPESGPLPAPTTTTDSGALPPAEPGKDEEREKWPSP